MNEAGGIGGWVATTGYKWRLLLGDTFRDPEDKIVGLMGGPEGDVVASDLDVCCCFAELETFSVELEFIQSAHKGEFFSLIWCNKSFKCGKSDDGNASSDF